MAYSTDDDLIKVQKDILNLGVDEWVDQHVEAELIIDRDIIIGWFNVVADEKGHLDPFDSELLLLPEQVLRLSVYKTLELAYLFVMMDGEDGAFRDKRELFKSMYNDELIAVLSAGLTYDWDSSGNESANESNVSLAQRVITR